MNLKGHEALYSLLLLRPELFQIRRQPIVKYLLVMLDDVHKLTLGQRESLFDTLLSSRWPVEVWLAERLEALEPAEMLSFGTTVGRDYEIIKLEDYWGRKQPQFKSIATDIATLSVTILPQNQAFCDAICARIILEVACSFPL